MKKALLIIFLIMSVFCAFLLWSVSDYRNKSFGFSSSIAQSLRIFQYNQSALPDPVRACWYDSGDYVVFLSRNTQTFYYLTRAYAVAMDPAAKRDILTVLTSQKKCIDVMLAHKYKQFGDQKSHGRNIPPFFHSIFFPRNVYRFHQQEGRDVAVLYGLALKQIGYREEGDRWIAIGRSLSAVATSENCCEEGPLVLDADQLNAINQLAGLEHEPVAPDWGISFRNLALLDSGQFAALREYLAQVSDKWNAKNVSNFDYIGGNYDIAGTVALERLYARAAHDDSFKMLSISLMDYLRGKNIYEIDFTNYPRIYHPCVFFGDCRLRDVLINGIDESLEFNPQRQDAWRITEMQLVGQAKYVLAKVVFDNL